MSKEWSSLLELSKNNLLNSYKQYGDTQYPCMKDYKMFVSLFH